MAVRTLSCLSQALGYYFKKPALLKQALTHCSVRGANNERLELLGDAVLGMIITAALFKQHPNASEGELSYLRASLVCEKNLVALAEEISLFDYIRLGASELGQRYKKRPALLADTLEAIIGAIYLDATWSDCTACVLSWYREPLAKVTYVKADKDPKTALQEYLQGIGNILPRYRLLSQTGKAHEAIFTVCCELASDVEHSAIVAQGVGKNRRAAEQAAAAKLLMLLGRQGDPFDK